MINHQTLEANHQALNGLKLVAGCLLDEISRERRAGRATEKLEASLDRIHAKARTLNTVNVSLARNIYLRGEMPSCTGTPVFTNFHTSTFLGGNKK
jgi:hypothetical protein